MKTEKIYKAYNGMTTREYFFKRKPNLKLLHEISEHTDSEKEDWEITEQWIYYNTKRKKCTHS